MTSFSFHKTKNRRTLRHRNDLAHASSENDAVENDEVCFQFGFKNIYLIRSNKRISIINAPCDAEATSYADVNNAAAVFLKREDHCRRRMYETASFALRHFSWRK